MFYECLLNFCFFYFVSNFCLNNVILLLHSQTMELMLRFIEFRVHIDLLEVGGYLFFVLKDQLFLETKQKTYLILLNCFIKSNIKEM